MGKYDLLFSFGQPGAYNATQENDGRQHQVGAGLPAKPLSMPPAPPPPPPPAPRPGKYAMLFEVSPPPAAPVEPKQEQPPAGKYSSLFSSPQAPAPDMYDAAGRDTGVNANLLRAIDYAETGHGASLVSPTGVRGRMQLTQATAKQYGVDRNDPTQAALGAARFVLDLHKQFGDDSEAIISAYNTGAGVVKEAQQLAQRNGTDWRDEIGNTEAINPVVRQIMAAKGPESLSFEREKINKIDEVKQHRERVVGYYQKNFAAAPSRSLDEMLAGDGPAYSPISEDASKRTNITWGDIGRSVSAGTSGMMSRMVQFYGNKEAKAGVAPGVETRLHKDYEKFLEEQGPLLERREKFKAEHVSPERRKKIEGAEKVVLDDWLSLKARREGGEFLEKVSAQLLEDVGPRQKEVMEEAQKIFSTPAEIVKNPYKTMKAAFLVAGETLPQMMISVAGGPAAPVLSEAGGWQQAAKDAGITDRDILHDYAFMYGLPAGIIENVLDNVIAAPIKKIIGKKGSAALMREARKITLGSAIKALGKTVGKGSLEGLEEVVQDNTSELVMWFALGEQARKDPERAEALLAKQKELTLNPFTKEWLAKNFPTFMLGAAAGIVLSGAAGSIAQAPAAVQEHSRVVAAEKAVKRAADTKAAQDLFPTMASSAKPVLDEEQSLRLREAAQAGEAQGPAPTLELAKEELALLDKKQAPLQADNSKVAMEVQGKRIAAELGIRFDGIQEDRNGKPLHMQFTPGTEESPGSSFYASSATEARAVLEEQGDASRGATATAPATPTETPAVKSVVPGLGKTTTSKEYDTAIATWLKDIPEGAKFLDEDAGVLTVAENYVNQKTGKRQIVIKTDDGFPIVMATIRPDGSVFAKGFAVLADSKIVPSTPAPVTPDPAARTKAPEVSAAAGQEFAHVRRDGFNITIENPVGSMRSGTDPGGKAWSQELKSDYGYILGTLGKDKDHLDVFIKPGSEEGGPVFVVNQVNPKTGKFDEHKILMGYPDQAAAQTGYLENYEPGWKGMGEVVPVTTDELRGWLESGETQEPLSREWFDGEGAETAPTLAQVRAAAEQDAVAVAPADGTPQFKKSAPGRALVPIGVSNDARTTGRQLPVGAEEAQQGAVESAGAPVSDQEVSAALAKVLAKHSGVDIGADDTPILAAPPTEDAALAGELVEHLFGKHLSWFDSEKVAPKLGFGIDGLTLGKSQNPALQNRIFMDIGTDRPVLWTAKHEIWHAIAADRPDLAEPMERALRVSLNEKGRKHLAALEASGLSPEAAMQEFAADFAGEQMVEPEFLSELERTDPAAFAEFVKRAIRAVSDMIKKAVAYLGNRPSKEVNNLKALRSRLAKTLSEYKKSGGAAGAPVQKAAVAPTPKAGGVDKSPAKVYTKDGGTSPVARGKQQVDSSEPKTQTKDLLNDVPSYFEGKTTPADDLRFAIRFDKDSFKLNKDGMNSAHGLVVASTGRGISMDVPFTSRSFKSFGTDKHDSRALKNQKRIIESVPKAIRDSKLSLKAGTNKLEFQPVLQLSAGCGRDAAILAAIQDGVLPTKMLEFMTSCHGACYKNFDNSASSGASLVSEIVKDARKEIVDKKPRGGSGYPTATAALLSLAKELGVPMKAKDIAKPSPKKESPAFQALKDRIADLPMDQKIPLVERIRKTHWGAMWVPQEAMTPMVVTPERVKEFFATMKKSTVKNYLAAPSLFFRGNQQGDWMQEVAAGSWEVAAQAMWDKGLIGPGFNDKKLSAVTAAWYVDLPFEQLQEIAERYKDVMILQVTGPWDFPGPEGELRIKGYDKLRRAGLDPVMRLITDEFGMGGQYLNDPETMRQTLQYIIDTGLPPGRVLETPLHIDDPGLAKAQGGKGGAHPRNVAAAAQRMAGLFDSQPDESEVMARALFRKNRMFLAEDKSYPKGHPKRMFGHAEVPLTYDRLRELGVMTDKMERGLRKLGFYHEFPREGGTVAGPFPFGCCTTGKCRTCGPSCLARAIAADAAPGKLKKIVRPLAPTDAAVMLKQAADGDEPKFAKKPEERQLAETAQKYGGEEAYKKARGEDRTVLSYNQWLQVRTPAFKTWFGDWEKHVGKEPGSLWSDETVSKAINEKTGEPLEVYHGTEKAGFTEFKTSNHRAHPGTIFLSSHRDVARTYSGTREEAEFSKTDEEGYPIEDPKRGVYSVFINLKNPLEAHFDGANWDGTRAGQYVVRDENDEIIYDEKGRGHFDDQGEAEKLAARYPNSMVEPVDEDHPETTNSVAAEAIRYGHDGAIIRDVVDDGSHGETYDRSTVFVVTDPSQIKSSIHNTGAFSKGSDDIRFAKKAAAEDGTPARKREQSQVNTPAFKKWFGDWEKNPKHASKIVDADGAPMVVYHGTPGEGFTVFDKARGGSGPITGNPIAAHGFFFHDKPALTKTYSGEEGTVIPAYLSMKKPYVMDMWRDFAALSNARGIAVAEKVDPFVEKIKAKGHDGILLKGGEDYTEYMVFSPTQIKSATDNQGTFDPANPDIRFAKKPVAKPDTPALITTNEDESVSIKDFGAITPAQWTKISNYMKRKGYDYRGGDDARTLFERQLESNEYTRDQAAALKHVLTPKPKEPVTPEKRIEAKARRYFGVTDDLRFGGYILSDGKMLDLSGRRQGNTYADSRSLDHREISAADDDATGGTAGMQEFIAAGNIRMDINSGMLDIGAPLTPKQRQAVTRFAMRSKEGVIVDLSRGLGEKRDGYYLGVDETNLEYDPKTPPSKILADIDAYFSGAAGGSKGLAAQFHESEEPKFAKKRKHDQVGSPEFKNWFGDWEASPASASKVVDKDGRPLVVYHGTSYDKLENVFKARPNQVGVHFGTSGQANDRLDYVQRRGAEPESGTRAYPVYLSIKKPLRLPDAGDWRADNLYWELKDRPEFAGKVPVRPTIGEIRSLLKAHGYDGIVYKNVGEVEGGTEYAKRQDASWKHLVETHPETKNGTISREIQRSPEYAAHRDAAKEYAQYRKKAAQDSYIVFSANQVKSAIANTGAFGKRTPDIRFARKQQQGQVTTPEFKAWFGDWAGAPEKASKVVDEDGAPLIVYRGQHGESDKAIHGRRGSIAFGDKETASTYAVHPNDAQDTPHSPRVIPAYLSIKNPIINTDDMFAPFSDLAEALGPDVAKRFALKYADAIEESGYWEEEFGEYDGVADLLEQDPSALSKLDVEGYRLLDDHEFVAAAKKAGYDGAILDGAGENALEREYHVFDESQIKSAIGNRGTFDPENSDIRFAKKDEARAPAPAFFSPTERSLSEIDQEKGVVPRIKSMLRTGKLKKAEADWMGLELWLDEHPKATKAEVLEFVRQNEVQVEEVEKGTKDAGEMWHLGSYMGKKNIKVNQHGDGTWHVWDNDNKKDYGPYSSEDEAKDAAKNTFKLKPPKYDRTKYSEYTLPGAENYREVLLTLPAKKGGGNVDVMSREELAEWWEKDIGYNPLLERPDMPTEDLRAVVRELGSAPVHAERVANTYKSSHWNEPNVVSHTRLTDRTGPGGEKVLFVEEIQSDWAREAREKGVVGQAEPAQQQYGISIGGDAPNLFFDTEAAAADRIEQIKGDFEEPLSVVAVQRPVRSGAKPTGVPNQPFLKNWQELTMKRVLRMAAEEGYDRVAWINGEQTAERYDLSKQVDELIVDRQSNGKGYSVQGRKGRGEWQPLVSNLSEEALPGAIGKDQARNALEQLSGDQNRARLSGLDLKVGGEWAANLYDKMLPKFLEKYGKKWGVAVEPVSIGVDPMFSVMKFVGGEFAVVKQGSDEPVEVFDDKRDAEALAAKMNGVETYNNYVVQEVDGKFAVRSLESGEIYDVFFIKSHAEQFAARMNDEAAAKKPVPSVTTQQSIAITPEMRESVLYEGQPMFAKRQVKPGGSEKVERIPVKPKMPKVRAPRQKKPEALGALFNARLSEVEQIEGEVRRLRLQMRQLSDDRMLERAAIQLKINNYDTIRHNQVVNEIYDYAKKLRLSRFAFNRVDTLMKNSRTAASLRQAVAIMDNTVKSREKGDAYKKLMNLIEGEYRRLHAIQGKTMSTVDLETNRHLKDYLDHLTDATTEEIQRLDKAIAYMQNYSSRDIKQNPDFDPAKLPKAYRDAITEWMEDPKKSVPESLRQDIRAVFETNLVEMTTEQLQEVRQNILDIKATGRTRRQAARDAAKVELEESAARIVARLEVDVEKKPQALMNQDTRQRNKLLESARATGHSILFENLRPERIVEWFEGFQRGELTEKVFTPLYEAAKAKHSSLEKALARFDEIHGGIDFAEVSRKPFMKVGILYEDKKTGKMTEKTVQLTLDQMMFIYAHSQNPGNRAHLYGTGYDDIAIEAVTNRLPDQYRQVVDAMLDYNDTEQYPRMNEAFIAEHEMDMPKEHRYFRIMNLAGDKATEGQLMADVLARYGSRRAMVQKGMTRQRVQSNTPFERESYLETATKSIIEAEHYITHSGPVRQVMQYLNHRALKPALMAKSPEGYNALQEWVKSVAYGKLPPATNWHEKLVSLIRRNYVTSVLGGNIVTILKQPASFVQGVGMLKNKANALPAAFRTLNDTMKMIATTNPLKWGEVLPESVQFMMDKSVFMRMRSTSVEREFMEALEKSRLSKMLKAQGLWDKFHEFSMSGIQAADMATVSTIWNARYREALNETMDESKAIEAADYAVRRTQPMGTMIDLPASFRTGPWLRAFSMFLNQPNQNFNLVVELVGKWKNTPPTENASRVFWWIIASSAVVYMASHGGRLPWDDPEGWADFLVDTMTGGIVLVNWFADAATTGVTNKIRRARGKKTAPTYNRNFTNPVLDVMSEGGALARGEMTLLRALQFAGKFSGVPALAQTNRTARGIEHAVDNKDFRYVIWSKGALEDVSVENAMAKRLVSSNREEKLEASKWLATADEKQREKFYNHLKEIRQENR
jgi:soluble lytic murein transglycosylase-like protein